MKTFILASLLALTAVSGVGRSKTQCAAHLNIARSTFEAWLMKTFILASLLALTAVSGVVATSQSAFAGSGGIIIRSRRPLS